ncbi:MAG: 3-isopropylmalate dehydratase small subunit [Hyphomicrobiaceae bacterium]
MSSRIEPLQTIRGRAVGLEAQNIDTDQIVPARFLYRNRADGFADTLFRDMRLDANGHKNPYFVLNRPDAEGAEIMVALDNFGYGSSREHAVWALMDAGFRVVIAVSFGDIFYNNALENGLLPVVLEEQQVSLILDRLKSGQTVVEVDLKAQFVTLSDRMCFRFRIDQVARENLLLGRGKIESTLALRSEIEQFENIYAEHYPWAK